MHAQLYIEDPHIDHMGYSTSFIICWKSTIISILVFGNHKHLLPIYNIGNSELWKTKVYFYGKMKSFASNYQEHSCNLKKALDSYHHENQRHELLEKNWQPLQNSIPVSGERPESCPVAKSAVLFVHAACSDETIGCFILFLMCRFYCTCLEKEMIIGANHILKINDFLRIFIWYGVTDAVGDRKPELPEACCVW